MGLFEKIRRKLEEIENNDKKKEIQNSEVSRDS